MIDDDDRFMHSIRDNKLESFPLAWQIFDRSNGEKSFAAPLVRVNPNYMDSCVPNDYFPYADFDLLSVDSGTAIGGSLTEAIVHGVMEIIERNALSFF